MFDDANSRSQTAGATQDFRASDTAAEDLVPRRSAILRDWLREPLHVAIAQHRERRRSFALIWLRLDRDAESTADFEQTLAATIRRLRYGLRRRDHVIRLTDGTLAALLQGIVGDPPMPRLLERVTHLARSAKDVAAPLDLTLSGVRYPTEGITAETLLSRLERQMPAI